MPAAGSGNFMPHFGPPAEPHGRGTEWLMVLYSFPSDMDSLDKENRSEISAERRFAHRARSVCQLVAKIDGDRRPTEQFGGFLWNRGHHTTSSGRRCPGV